MSLESSVRFLLGQLGVNNEGAIDLKPVFIEMCKEGIISDEEYAAIYRILSNAPGKKPEIR